MKLQSFQEIHHRILERQLQMTQKIWNMIEKHKKIPLKKTIKNTVSYY